MRGHPEYEVASRGGKSLARAGLRPRRADRRGLAPAAIILALCAGVAVLMIVRSFLTIRSTQTSSPGASELGTTARASIALDRDYAIGELPGRDEAAVRRFLEGSEPAADSSPVVTEMPPSVEEATGSGASVSEGSSLPCQTSTIARSYPRELPADQDLQILHGVMLEAYEQLRAALESGDRELIEERRQVLEQATVAYQERRVALLGG